MAINVPQSSVAANNKFSLREFGFEHECPLIPINYSINFFINVH